MKIVPQIMLRGSGEQAIALWRDAIPGLAAQRILDEPALWRITSGVFEALVLDSDEPHDFAPTPAISFAIEVDTSAAVDEIAEKLASKVLMEAGTYDFAERYAWVEDPHGISWQITYRPA